MTGFLCRAATADDVDGVRALFAALWPDQPASSFPDDLDGLVAAVNASSVGTILVAEAEAAAQLIGVVAVGERAWSEGATAEPVAYVEGWYVAAGWRRRGVGRALFAAAEAWAKAQGYAQIASDTEEHNLVSIAAHQALGYRIGERIVYFVRDL